MTKPMLRELDDQYKELTGASVSKAIEHMHMLLRRAHEGLMWDDRTIAEFKAEYGDG